MVLELLMWKFINVSFLSFSLLRDICEVIYAQLALFEAFNKKIELNVNVCMRVDVCYSYTETIGCIWI